MSTKWQMSKGATWSFSWSLNTEIYDFLFMTKSVKYVFDQCCCHCYFSWLWWKKKAFVMVFHRTGKIYGWTNFKMGYKQLCFRAIWKEKPTMLQPVNQIISENLASLLLTKWFLFSSYKKFTYKVEFQVYPFFLFA